MAYWIPIPGVISSQSILPPAEVPAPTIASAGLGDFGILAWEIFSNHNADATYSWTITFGGSQVASGTVFVAANGNSSFGLDDPQLSGSYCAIACSPTPNNCSNEVCQNVTVGGGCYLTTAMVKHYNYEDDGIELNSMRKIRSHMIASQKHEYIEMFKNYAQESNKIIAYINQPDMDSESYYSEIQRVVLKVVDLVSEQKITEAIELYWNFYLKLKEEILTN
jgi:hypothetical protein